MSRLGFTPSEVGEVASRLADGGLIEVAGFMTHLASADGRRVETARQLDLFDAAVADLAARGIRPRWVHAANSAGLAFLRPTHTLARPGLLLYGLRPRPLCPEVAVRPVLSLSARVSLLKDVPPGTEVSYGGLWSAGRPSRIATVPVGYADGVPRSGCGTTSAARAFVVRGARARIAGAVCMDLTMLDVTDRPAVSVGDEAVVFGDDPTAWDVADWAGTNAWDVLTGVGSRVPRVYVSGGQVVDVDSRYHG
jgi:alanine racemase